MCYEQIVISNVKFTDHINQIHNLCIRTYMWWINQADVVWLYKQQMSYL